MKREVTINGRTYPVSFSMGALRSLGRSWGCKGLVDTAKRLEVFGDIGQSEDGLTFEQEDMIRDLVLASIRDADKEITLPTSESVLDALYNDAESMIPVMEVLSEAMPKADSDDGKKPTAAKKEPAAAS